jgi:phenylacetate-CoA ligase
VNPSFLRRILVPLHERLVGRPTFARLGELERSQWWPPERIRDLQVSKLRSLLTHAWQHCPFYRQRLAEVDFCASDVTAIEYLRRLPLLRKQEIRDHRIEMRWPQVAGGLRRYNTGGSTGEPLIFDFDLGRQAFDQAARMRTHRWFGVDVGMKEVYLWGSPVELSRQDRIKSLRDRLTNQLLLSAFDMSADRMDEYLSRIEAYDPACLFGYPSSIALLCDHALARRRRVRLPHLRAVFVTGERLFDHHRERIRDTFGVPVADCYGSREGGFVAHECPSGSMHVTQESLIVEILDEGGSPARPGSLGQIVLTHLDTYGMPFIRYCTGDMGRLAEGACPCGRGLERLHVVEGRQTDFVVAADGTIKHALSLIYVVRDVEGVRRFQIVQAANRDVTVRVVVDRTLPPDERRRIESGIRLQIGEGIGVQVIQTDRIAPSSSGKYRYVVSEAVPRTT